MKPDSEGGPSAIRLLTLRTSRRTELVDLTAQVERAVAAAGVRSGVCYLTVPHTTAGIVVNENDDPNVARDIEAVLDKLAPPNDGYRHLEGNADAHIKSALVGVSQVVFIEGGRLALGRWQGIFFCEFDGPRERQVRLKILADSAE